MSEVIGFILVTAIVIVASAVVLTWGQPALDRVQSHEEVDSMIRFFSVLETEVSGLSSGAPEGSTPIWRVAMPRGTLNLDEDGHVWGFVAELAPEDIAGIPQEDYRIAVGGFSDEDNTFTVRNEGVLITTPTAKAFSYDGVDQTVLTPPAIAAMWGPGGERDISLELGGVDQNIPGGSYEVRLYDNAVSATEPFARIFFEDSGALIWQLPAGGDIDRVIFENTAVIAQQDDTLLLHNTPRLPAPKSKDGDTESIFLRVIRLSGSASLSGRMTGEVLLGGGGNHGRFAASSVERVQLYPSAVYATDVWNTFLDDDIIGNTYTVESLVFGAETVWRATRDADAAGGQLAATLVETPISLEVVRSV